MDLLDTIIMTDITKKFGDFVANDEICFEARQGEIHAILGENGAGKTTLMNILYGLYKCTSGTICINGKYVNINSPADSIEHGIGMIHQHFMLVRAFTVLENIVLGLKSAKGPFVDRETTYNWIVETSKENGFSIDPNAKISDLTVSQQQQVEILKALFRGAKILIMDEPTSVLTPQETKGFFATLKNLIKQGHTILFISHKLDEVLEICDRCTILRKGRKIGTIDLKGVTKKQLAELMIGREFSMSLNKKEVELGAVSLEVEDLSTLGQTVSSSLKKVSFEIRTGQIVGVAGVDGNGQKELIEVLSGLRKSTEGSFRVCGEDMTNKDPLTILEAGVALVPEDRNHVGVIGEFDLVENSILRSYYKKPYVKHGFINYKEAHKLADEIIDKYDVRAASKMMRIENLSGGNVQKMILGREINFNPCVLLAMHPTRGLDVGSIEFVHERLLSYREQGGSILFVSTELDEIMSLSDKIVVLYNGEIMGIVDAARTNAEEIGLMMLGVDRRLN